MAEDDILETALNSGIKQAAQKYSISENEVKEIVGKFKKEIDLPCSCEQARARGETRLCLICDRPSRINL